MQGTMRVGLYLGTKQAAWLAAFQNEAKEYGKRTGLRVEVEGLDFDRLEEQNFSVILHKMCTHIALYKTDAKMRRELDQLEAYFAKHPEVAFDSLDVIRDINDREVVAEKLRSFSVSSAEGRVSQPPFEVAHDAAEARALRARGPKFGLPWVCKPIVADGVPSSHDLAMVVRDEGLEEAPLPFVLQPFVNHDGEIVKVYVLGDTVLQLRRPSLPNVARPGEPVMEGPAFVPFGRISNPNALPSDSKVRVLPDDQLAVPLVPEALLQAAVKELKMRLQVQLFGVDLIRESATGDYLLIDVNFCPGYYGVSNVFEKLLELFRAKVGM